MKELGNLLKREIKFARPDLKYQEVAAALGITYQQLFARFRAGKFTDDELDKILKMIGARQEHFIITEDGRRVDI